jgi:chorismate dehydratase
MESLRVSIWKDPILNELSERLISCQEVTSITRGKSREIIASLESGETDVAVLPTPYVLQNKDAFNVLPEMAVSSRSHPVFRLHLQEGFAKSDVRVSVSSDQVIHGLMAAIILREHYNFRLRKDLRDPASKEEDKTVQDAWLVRLDESNQSVPVEEYEFSHDRDTPSSLTLDLGSEWYELVNYPMVWALFVMKKGTASEEAVKNLISIVTSLDQDQFQAERSVSSVVERGDFSEIKYRFDESCLASLTEMEEYLYYYGIVSDISDFAELPWPKVKN